MERNIIFKIEVYNTSSIPIKLSWKFFVIGKQNDYCQPCNKYSSISWKSWNIFLFVIVFTNLNNENENSKWKYCKFVEKYISFAKTPLKSRKVKFTVGWE